MKNAWIIIAIIFILQPIIPVVNYFVDYEYISTVLCINKETPSVQCNGKCQLGKELATTILSEIESKKVGNYDSSTMFLLSKFLEKK